MPAQHSTADRQTGIVRLLLLAVAVWCVLASPASGAVGVRDFCCRVPMSDGLRLATHVYLPRFPKGRCPVILIRTPYPLDQFGRLEARFACREGFGLAVRDSRFKCASRACLKRVRKRAVGSGRRLLRTPLFVQDGWMRIQDDSDGDSLDRA